MRRFLTPEGGTAPTPRAKTMLNQPASRSIYDRVFWLSYLANFLLVTAHVMTFRFAEFVRLFGGTEGVAGFIVSCGVIAALVGRLFLGQAIDRLGVRRLWLLVTSIFLVGCLLMMSAGTIGAALYLGRVAFAVGLAGMFTCSIFHAQNRAPRARRTEVIGNLGSSGFLGMISGSQLCDFLGEHYSPVAEPGVVFGTVAALAAVYLVLVVFITREDLHEPPSITPPAHRLLLLHWPGPVVLVALLMGMYFTIPSVYLTRFSTHRGLGGIGLYWTAYAVMAFVFRVSTRRWSQTVGRHRMIQMGIAGHLLANLILPFATVGWHLVFPAVLSGLGHALLFPAVVSLGTEAFPRVYRGTGTTLVLGFFDIGGAVSAPILGAIIDGFGGVGFPQMFWFAAACSVVVAVAYQCWGASRPDSDLLAPAEGGAGPQTAHPSGPAEPTCEPLAVVPDREGLSRVD